VEGCGGAAKLAKHSIWVAYGTDRCCWACATSAAAPYLEQQCVDHHQVTDGVNTSGNASCSEAHCCCQSATEDCCLSKV
jgi:hypothetical protein